MNSSATSLQQLKLIRTRATSNTGLSNQRPSYNTTPLHVSFDQEVQPARFTTAFDEKLRKQAQQLYEQNETLKSRLDVVNSSMDHLNERIRRKDEQYNRTATNLQMKSVQCYQLRESADELARKNKAYKKQSKDMQNDLRQAREQLRVQRQLRVDLQSEKNDLLEKLQSLQESGEALVQHIYTEQIQRITSDYQSRIDALNQTNSTLSMKIGALEKQINSSNQQANKNQQKSNSIINEMENENHKLSERVIQMQQTLKQIEKEKSEWEHEKLALKQIQNDHTELAAKYQRLSTKYGQLIQLYNETVASRKQADSQVKDLKSRLRLAQSLRECLIDRQQHRMLELPSAHAYSAIEHGKVVNSYFLDDNRSSGSYHNGSGSINNFGSLNMQSVISKKPLTVNKSNSAISKGFQDSKKERVQALRSEQDENILMTQQYIPTGQHTEQLSRIEDSCQRKVGGIRSRSRRNKSNFSRQQENESPQNSLEIGYQHNEITNSRSQANNSGRANSSSNDNGEAFQQLLHRFEQVKSRSRERIV